MNFDQATITALLNRDNRQIQRLARQARQAIGEECPHCGSRGEHESNANVSTFICGACGEMFDSK